MRAKTFWTDEQLKTRVCKRLHVGNWARRSNGQLACRDCQREASIKFRSGNPGTGSRPRSMSAQSLREHIAKLEEALKLAKEKLELFEQLESVQKKLKELS